MATFETKIIDFSMTSPLNIVKGSKEKQDPVGKEFLRK